MRKRLALTGNEAAAYAMKQIDPDVVAAYPITPATEIVQIFSNYVAKGEVSTEFIAVESEHSALSACIGAGAAGARVMTATSSQGLALMHEMLYIASGLRVPLVLTVANRSLSAPINIHCDHSDAMGSRDSGWIQIYCENSQEVYDTLIMAVRISEKSNLPVMVNMDGFILSHGMEAVETLSNEEVKEFIGERKPSYSILDIENPVTIGPLSLPDSFEELKKNQSEAIREAKKAIEEVQEEFMRKFGRRYEVIESYRLEDAKYGVLLLGSTAGAAKEAADEARENGEKVGVARLRVVRPLPREKIIEALERLEKVCILDRADSLSAHGGPLFNEIRSVLYDLERKPEVFGMIYGLGGRDTTDRDILNVFDMMVRNRMPKEVGTYLGLREVKLPWNS